MPVFNSTSWFITIYNFYSTRTNIKHILTKSINCNCYNLKIKNLIYPGVLLKSVRIDETYAPALVLRWRKITIHKKCTLISRESLKFILLTKQLLSNTFFKGCIII